jgi:hypothetical protein
VHLVTSSEFLTFFKRLLQIQGCFAHSDAWYINTILTALGWEFEMPVKSKVCSKLDPLTYYVRFEVFPAVTKKNAISWDVTPCGSCKNRHFGGMYHLHHQDDKNRWTRNVSCNKRLKHAVTTVVTNSSYSNSYFQS